MPTELSGSGLATAHRDLEGRRITGAGIIIP
jgi:hypothetical protein